MVFPILLAVSVAMLTPLIVGKVLRCNEDERIMERADKGGQALLPRAHQLRLECFRKHSAEYEWEEEVSFFLSFRVRCPHHGHIGQHMAQSHTNRQ